MKIKLSKPTLIIVAGAPGSGKSEFCQYLPKYINDLAYIEKDPIAAVFLMQRSKDDIKNNLWSITGAKISVTDQFYKDHVRSQTYQCMLNLALLNLQKGNNALIESNYIKEIKGEYFKNVIKPMFQQYNTKMLFFHADEDTIKKRLAHRGADRDQEKLASEIKWQEWIKAEPLIPKELERYDHLKINSTIPFDNNLNSVLEYLQN